MRRDHTVIGNASENRVVSSLMPRGQRRFSTSDAGELERSAHLASHGIGLHGHVVPYTKDATNDFVAAIRTDVLYFDLERATDVMSLQQFNDTIEVTHVEAQGILTKTRGFTSVSVPGTGFHYSLNPYRGCAFNCSYCYAPAFTFDDEARARWGRWVAVKANAEQLLRAAGRKGRLQLKNVYLSTVTDPYQPIERKLELTRACLAALLDFPPRLLTVQTRSPLVVRDIDLFQRMTPGRIAVCMSITTDDEAVRRIFEPSCAPIAARVEAIRTIRQAGIPTQASIAPLLPCDPVRLAELLDPAVDWVVVSTFRDDGGNGGKTRAWAAELYREHGYGSYLHDGDHQAEQVIAVLRERLGPERVRVGKDGFDQVCRELGVDEPTAEQTSFLQDF